MLLLPTKSNELQPGRYQANHLQIANIFVCPNFQMYLLKVSNIFGQLLQSYISSHYLSAWAVSAGGIKPPICWLGAGCHIFQRTPDFPISSPGFLRIPEMDLPNICNLSALWSAADPDERLNLSHALIDLMSKKCQWISSSKCKYCHFWNAQINSQSQLVKSRSNY